MSTTEEESSVFWYLNLSPKQTGAVQQLRAALSDSGLRVSGQDAECELLRFLQARDWKVPQAAKMYREMLAWRQAEAVDDLYGNDPTGKAFPEMKEVLQAYPHFMCKTDKFGRPVYIELVGRTDADRLARAITAERLVRYHVWTWERCVRRYLPACSAAAGRPIITTTNIIDCKGLHMAQLNRVVYKVLRLFSKIDQDYYPEHMGSVFIINAPAFLLAMWTALKTIWHGRIQSRMVILGSDYLEQVTKVVPLENLPTILGGKVEIDAEYTSVGPWDDPRWDPALLPLREQQ